MSFSIFTAYPRGYCAGVHRAVGMLMEVVAMHPAPIYVNHEIIHNTFVVKMFERKGVIFEPDLEKIPPNSLVVISAHGTGPSYFEKLRAKKMRWIDATCPLVEKVHREARDFIAKGYHILYIGKKGHQEAVGVMDEGEKYFTLIEKEEDLAKIVSDSPPEKGESEGVTQKGIHNNVTHPNLSLASLAAKSADSQTFSGKGGKNHTIQMGEKLALLTQTTLSVDDTASLITKIQERFPDIVLPKAGDICYATTNRQKAVKVLAERVDVVLVVGSKNSSNSSKLRHVAEDMGKCAYLVDSHEDIDRVWFEGISSVGVTAGASGPEELVEEVVKYLEDLGGVFSEELRVVEERVEFPYTLKIQS